MKKIILTIVLGNVMQYAIAQGCSDAGFCSLSVLKNQQGITKLKTSFTVGINYGSGEQNTSSINPYLEYSRKLNSAFSFQAKLTATYASGFLGSNFNAGDIFTFITHTSSTKNKGISFTLLGGLKLPLTSANDKNSSGKPLPLDYQSSIGTFDAIIGFNFIAHKKWEINGGLQVPVINSNKNSFFPDEYSDTRIKNFAPTNNFERKSDALLRLGYYVALPKSFTIKPNLLAIYHLSNDTYEDRFGKRQSIIGSDGLTLNGGVVFTKSFNKKSELELILATPFIVRDIRPDGLTRKAVINVQYKFNF